MKRKLLLKKKIVGLLLLRSFSFPVPLSDAATPCSPLEGKKKSLTCCSISVEERRPSKREEGGEIGHKSWFVKKNGSKEGYPPSPLDAARHGRAQCPCGRRRSSRSRRRSSGVVVVVLVAAAASLASSSGGRRLFGGGRGGGPGGARDVVDRRPPPLAPRAAGSQANKVLLGVGGDLGRGAGRDASVFVFVFGLRA